MLDRIGSFDDHVSRHLKRNVALNVADGAFFFLGMTFVSLDTIVPVFIARLGGSSLAVSLVPVIMTVALGLFPLFSAPRIEQAERKKPAVIILGSLTRAAWLFAGVMTMLLAPRHGRILIVAILGAVFLHAFFGGLSLTPYLDLVAKVVPTRMRGRMFSARILFGYLAAVAGGMAVTRILGTLAYPLNFTVLFFLGFVLTMGCIACFAFMREPVYPVRPVPTAGSDYVKGVVAILRTDRRFVNLIIVRAFLTLAFSSCAFYSVYGIKHFSLPISHAGVFTIITVVSCVVVSPALGYLGDRAGHKVNLVIAAFPFAGPRGMICLRDHHRSSLLEQRAQGRQGLP